jgi:hypothetical protein
LDIANKDSRQDNRQERLQEDLQEKLQENLQEDLQENLQENLQRICKTLVMHKFLGGSSPFSMGKVRQLFNLAMRSRLRNLWYLMLWRN